VDFRKGTTSLKQRTAPLLLLTLLFILFSPQTASAERAARPSKLQLAGEFAAGVGGGFAGGAATFYIGSLFVSGDLSETDVYGLALPAIFIGYPLGSAVGVYLVGSLGEGSGSFKTTAAGAIGGGIVGSLFGLLGFPPAYIVSPPLGAMIGFNKSRREMVFSSALIRIDDDHTKVGFPAVYCRPSSEDRRVVLYSVDVVRVVF
jgi:hypothetical protein